MANKKTPSKPMRSKKQHTPDYYPIQRRVGLGNFGGAISSGTTFICDVGQIMSQTNRRLYRQGNMYQCKIDIEYDFTAVPSFEVDVYALVNNWDNQRAYALAKATYDKAMSDERKLSPKSVARWEDFRVSAGLTGQVSLHPVLQDRATLNSVVVNDGEFNGSIVDVGGTNTSFSWGQPGIGVLSLVGEWDLAGQVTQTPASGETGVPYGGVNADDMSDAEKLALRERGDLPPYNQNNNPEVWVKVGKLFFRDTAGGGIMRTSTGFFDAPCGLVAIVPTTSGGGNLSNDTLKLEVKSGDYKGVSAKAMCQQME